MGKHFCLYCQNIEYTLLAILESDKYQMQTLALDFQKNKIDLQNNLLVDFEQM
jgi:hypothetical protein